MYRVFKPTYTEKGETREGRTYHISFRDHQKRRQRVAGYPDEKRTHSLAGKVERLVECRQSGRGIGDDLVRWIDTLDPALRAKLVAMDLLDPRMIAADHPLAWHLEGRKDEQGGLIEPGYRQALIARGNTPKHAATTVQRIADTLAACGFTVWRDLIQPGATTRVEVWLGGRRAAGKITGKTYNYYCRELRGFCRWMASTDRAPAVAMAELTDVTNANADSKETRPLSIGEMRWLVETTAVGGMRAGLDGRERAILYRFAFETGIRPGQIRELVVSDFDLSSATPTVTARASSVKRRVNHTQAIKPSLAAELAKLFATKFPDAPALAMPSRFHMADMLRRDLAVARSAWLDAAPTPAERIERAKSDFLADVNHQKQRATFYSTRHGHGTALAEAGVAEKDIAASMHHTSRATTARYYLHSDRRAVREAVDALPDLSYPDRQIATGTAGVEGDGEQQGGGEGETLRQPCATRRTPMDSGGQIGQNAPVDENPDTDAETLEFAGIGAEGDDRPSGGIGRRNGFKIRRTPQESPGNTEISPENAETLRQPCAAGDSDPLLTEFLTLWPTLTPDQRRKVLAGVRRMTK